MNNRPKVSLIIPYVNDRGWLGDALLSAANQTYAGEIEIIEAQSPGTVGRNINAALKKVTGKYLKYFAEDDFMEPDCVKDCVEFLERTGAKWLHANSNVIWEQRPANDKNHVTIHKPDIQNPTFS